jgi:hypothetical protein
VLGTIEDEQQRGLRECLLERGEPITAVRQRVSLMATSFYRCALELKLGPPSRVNSGPSRWHANGPYTGK